MEWLISGKLRIVCKEGIYNSMNYSYIDAYVRWLLCHKLLLHVAVEFLEIRPLLVSVGINDALHYFEIFHDGDEPTYVSAFLANFV
jgi:hypothetical protein